MESDKAQQLVRRQIEAIDGLDGQESHTPSFKKWKRDTEIAIEKVFGKSSRHLRDFGVIRFSAGRYYMGMPDDAGLTACRNGLANARAILQSMAEEIEQYGLPTSPNDSANQISNAEAKVSELVFVSHSSADKDLADALLDMLCTALHLRLSDFLCTSVAGAKLKGGDDTDEVLRREIRDVPAFLSILTRQAVTSTYVSFELGARWGSAKHHIPLLGKGSGSEVLREPLKATNALRLSDEADVLQLVENLAEVLSRKAEPPNSFLKKARKVVEISNAVTTPQPVQEVSKSSPSPAAGAARRSPYTKALIAAVRGPNRIDEDAERVLVELAGQGDLVSNPMDTAGFLGMHRVRLEWCVNYLVGRDFVKDLGMIGEHSFLRILDAGKQYLMENGVI